MDQFPEGAHVRLRSPVHGGYLHADEDGEGVSLRWRCRASMNSAWQVHRTMHDGTTCVLLHGAAYGRYLAASPHPAPPGHRVVQADYDGVGAGEDALLWKGVGSGYAGFILLRHVSYRLLRANGRYRPWNAAASLDDADSVSTMMHWAVEAIPPRPQPPALPPPTPATRGSFRSLFLQHPEPVALHRTIRYVRADDHGNFNPNGWATFQFHGRSVWILRTEVARRLGNAFYFFRVLMCTRAGRYGRLTPLLVDLPRNEETVDVIVLITGTPAADELRFPNVEETCGQYSCQALRSSYPENSKTLLTQIWRNENWLPFPFMFT